MKELWKNWKKNGIPFLYAFDGSTKQPSITLLFAYLTFILVFISAIALHFFPNLLAASTFSLLFWIISFVMYRLRRIDKFKIDLDDKSLELESSGDNEGEKNG